MVNQSFGHEPKKAAIYARVQQNSQEQDNLALVIQVAQCLAYCQEQGYSVEEKHIYSQDQIEVIETALEPRPFDILVVSSIDRLSRIQLQATAIIDKLNQYGVTVESIDGSMQDDITQIKNAVKEEVERIQRNMIGKCIKYGKAAKKAQREQQH
jgi:DNA invertase Pin-like site-specific DNA recombinase